jgi:hypothetical protein
MSAPSFGRRRRDRAVAIWHPRPVMRVLAPFVVVVVSLLSGCAPAVGAEGGPCTGGGGCDPGLTCLSDLCVDAGEGEGEGEGGEGEGEGEGACGGDVGGDNGIDDCRPLPSNCAALSDSCEVAFRVLRAGLAQGAYDCFAAQPSSSCGNANAVVDTCFGGLTACDNASAQTVCGQIDQACRNANDTGFNRAGCDADLQPMNDDFIALYGDCFNANLNASCSVIHDGCYEDAFARLVNGT